MSLARLHNQSRNSGACKTVQIMDVRKRDTDSYTFKCADVNECQKLKTTLTREFAANVKISPVKEKRPQIKIIDIGREFVEDELIERIKAQNAFLADAQITAERIYSVPTRNGPCWNAVINCSIQTQVQILERDKLIIGLEAKHVFENVDLMQCKYCCRYGHFYRNCSSSSKNCRHCGDDHLWENCTKTNQPAQCINCIRANEDNPELNLSTNHRATNDRCQVRIERMEGLIKHFEKNE